MAPHCGSKMQYNPTYVYCICFRCSSSIHTMRSSNYVETEVPITLYIKYTTRKKQKTCERIYNRQWRPENSTKFWNYITMLLCYCYCLHLFRFIRNWHKGRLFRIYLFQHAIAKCIISSSEWEKCINSQVDGWRYTAQNKKHYFLIDETIEHECIVSSLWERMRRRMCLGTRQRVYSCVYVCVYVSRILHSYW